jgi:hypothetical protein
LWIVKRETANGKPPLQRAGGATEKLPPSPLNLKPVTDQRPPPGSSHQKNTPAIYDFFSF